MRRTWSAAIVWLLALAVWTGAQTKPLTTAQDIDALLAEARSLLTAGKRGPFARQLVSV